MGTPVRLRSVRVTFGPEPGATVAIKVGNDDSGAPSALAAFRTVATARGVGGSHAFRLARSARSARGRYVLIWFTRLPPAGPGKFQAEIFNIVVRGWH